jgi:protein involved in polysaccharide export with SLBB domain
MKLQIMPLSERPFLKIILALPLLALMLTGCATPDYTEVMEQPNGDSKGAPAAQLHPGDTITISFDGIPDPIPTQEKTINEDGTITLSDIGTIKAAGKTSGELEQAIHDLYVPRFVLHLSVTVKPGDRVFYVNGEVGSKGRQVYVGQITISKAITSAGGFLDFANHKNVLLIRANGKRYTVNCDKILQGEAPDPPIFPGDQIEVKRRRF